MRRALSHYSLPILIWMLIAGGAGFTCFGDCADELDTYFRSVGYSMKTVIQIMTFDSWTGIIDAINLIDSRYGGEPSGLYADAEGAYCCPSWVGNMWVYAVGCLFGLIFMNLLTGVLLEAVQGQTARTSDSVPMAKAPTSVSPEPDTQGGAGADGVDALTRAECAALRADVAELREAMTRMEAMLASALAAK